MSTDALLWISTLLFAATMLILAAMRPAEQGDGDGETPLASSGDSWDLGPPNDRGLDLGGGWTLGGDGDRLN